ncbi:MAG: glutathione S-transferase family protein [Parvibaculum sp.]|nr:glutathione S-transferase family protein [Parvibaculum sp.]
MTLTLYYHPLSSFCQKVMVAFYETGIPFTPRFIDFSKEEDRAALSALWPVGQFPVIRDEARGRTIPESSLIVEHLALNFPGGAKLLPRDAGAAFETRYWDRLFDLHVNQQMQIAMAERRKPKDKRDDAAAKRAARQIGTAYGLLEKHMTGREWAAGEDFSMADCAAAPALNYAKLIVPFGEHANVAAYHERLAKRPSFARALKESEPWLHFLATE